MPRKIESHFIAGPAGRLESLLEEPEDQQPREAVVVCHPHPQHGGTMHNKVVYRMARGFRRNGAVVLRFNYRGVNLSEGSYDGGRGETEDARAALSWLREEYPNLPFTLAGFSFGSRIVLKLGCMLSDARRIVAVGFPTTYIDRSYLLGCTVPRVFVHSTNDEHGPRVDFENMYHELAPPKELHWVEAEDHFFKGALDEFEQVIISLG
ncbi:MAG TPA: alpha/beta fold hydrolase [Bryobacteraceae bacterium]|nr:alpha/beta fold hydrolase [Bryobacteraceae bacterium]